MNAKVKISVRNLHKSFGETKILKGLDLEVRDGETLEVLRGPATGFVTGRTIGGQAVDFAVDERYVVVSGGSAGSQLVDLETLEPIGNPFRYDTPFRQGAVARDADLLATVVDGDVVVWDVDVDSWAATACDIAGRNFTRDEWDEFGPATIEYGATCEEFPIEE